MKHSYVLFASVLLSMTLGACSQNLPSAPSGADPAMLDRRAAAAAESHSEATVFTASGDITPDVNAFRNALGTLNPNVPGSLSGGRREINWDAVPAAFTNTNDFPPDFFNQPVVGRARGTVFSTPGTGFRTSDNNFADVKPDFDGPFVFFSPIRTFSAVGSNRTTVSFFVPGSNVPATSTGFGVVFSDVDRLGSASIQLFDVRGGSLGRYVAPTAPGGVSFVGVTFPEAAVARVEITSGRGMVVGIGADPDDQGEDRRGGPDLVIMDDFIYGEPTAVTANSPAAVAATLGGSR
jgi:hypothetical protein